MLARLQQFTTSFLLIAAAAWAFALIQSGHPAYAGLGAALIVFGYAIFLAAEFVLLWFAHGDDPTPRATPMQLLRAWWGEALAAPPVFCWRQPFHSNRHPDDLSRPGRGVVLVHGFLCNRGFWNPWLARLQSKGIPFVAVNLEPVFGSIGDYAPIVEAAVRQVEQATGLAPVVVGHSMGGLAIRAWMASFAGGERVHRVVTIGSPHHGTWLGRFGMSRNSREMALSTEWQESLKASESEAQFARFTCFYSHCDNIVFPASNATLLGADNRHIPGVAHVHLLDKDEVFDEVLGRVAAFAGKEDASGNVRSVR